MSDGDDPELTRRGAETVPIEPLPEISVITGPVITLLPALIVPAPATIDRLVPA